MEKIIIDSNARKQLVEEYSATAVSRALNYKSDSMLASEIRMRAINDLGGIPIKF